FSFGAAFVVAANVHATQVWKGRVARQQSRFSFGAAFLIAANVHATQVHVFWLTLKRSQSLANNRGSCLAPPSSLPQTFMQLEFIFLVEIGRISVARQQLRFLFGPAFLIAANVHATRPSMPPK
ncbi:hypothetical protein GGU11DRAFT_761133, partial [Lentinula aff. detonsa]